MDLVWSGNNCGIACKMFNNRDLEEEKKKDSEMKKQAALLAVAICSGPGNHSNKEAASGE